MIFVLVINCMSRRAVTEPRFTAEPWVRITVVTETAKPGGAALAAWSASNSAIADEAGGHSALGQKVVQPAQRPVPRAFARPLR